MGPGTRPPIIRCGRDRGVRPPLDRPSGGVEDARQLMYPEARREVPDFASGDLTGRALLGRGQCVPELCTPVSAAG